MAAKGEVTPSTSSVTLGEGESDVWNELHLITAKPVMYIANVAEDSPEVNPLVEQVRKIAAEQGAATFMRIGLYGVSVDATVGRSGVPAAGPRASATLDLPYTASNPIGRARSSSLLAGPSASRRSPPPENPHGS